MLQFNYTIGIDVKLDRCATTAMLRATLSILALSITTSAYAECWSIDSLTGYSAKAFEKYVVSKDGIADQKFKLTINASGASISPSNGLSCSKTTKTSAVCVANDGTQSTIETWSLDLSMRKAYQTQTRNGYGPLSGATLFIGNITGNCE